MHPNADDPELSEVFPYDDDVPEPPTHSNITHLKGKPEAEESLVDMLTAILETLERRLVARLRRQGSVNFPAIK